MERSIQNAVKFMLAANVAIWLLCVSVGFPPTNIDAAERSSHWPTVRAAHLVDHPTCAACGAAKNLVVHHVVPFHERPELELDPSNLITLCESPSHNCHFVFGHLLSYRSWNAEVRSDAEAYLKKVKERP